MNEIIDIQKKINNKVKTRYLSEFEKIYFIGDMSTSFALRAPQIVEKLNNFSGVIVGRKTDEKTKRIKKILKVESEISILSFDEMLSEKRTNVLVVNFNDSFLGFAFVNYLKAEEFHTVDYLALMHDLDLVHTYMSVRDERRIVIESIRQYQNLFDKCNDKLSRDTLIARLKSLLYLDRSYLLPVIQSWKIFTKNANSVSGIYINDNAIFADVGAAHGDTVSQFYSATNGVGYKQIHAFEPDMHNFQALSQVCRVIQNATAYNICLSDTKGQLEFFEDAENRFGSRIVSSKKDEIGKLAQCEKIDNLLENVSILKVDVEGHEKAVITGAKELIKKDKPSMFISGYHYPIDLYELFELINDIHRYKNFAIRHYSVNLYDTNILFSERQRF